MHKKILFESFLKYGLFIFGFLLSLTLIVQFLFGENIIYGSMISQQFFENTNSAFSQFKAGVLGIFNWNFSLGFNILGDSQQAILHPIKL